MRNDEVARESQPHRREEVKDKSDRPYWREHFAKTGRLIAMGLAFLLGVVSQKSWDLVTDHYLTGKYTQATALEIGAEALAVLDALAAGPFRRPSIQDGLLVPVTLPSTPTWESIYRLAATPALNTNTAMALANASQAIHQFRSLPNDPIDLDRDTLNLDQIFARYERARQAALAQTMWAMYLLHRYYGVEFPGANMQAQPFGDAQLESVWISRNGVSLSGTWPRLCESWTFSGPHHLACQGTFSVGRDSASWSHRQYWTERREVARMRSVYVVEAAAGALIADLQVNSSDGPLALTREEPFWISHYSANATACQLQFPGGESGVPVAGFFGPISSTHPWYPQPGAKIVLSFNCTDGTRSAQDSVVLVRHH